MAEESPSQIPERAQELLRALVERYIKDGMPVGSRTLSKETSLEVSPATIRNVMSDLEEMGFIAAPHTSAGRIPTVKGYRMFIDSLLRVQPLRAGEVDKLKGSLPQHATDSGELIQAASNLLSGITHLAGVVTLPKQSRNSLRQIEFLRLSENRALAILVVNDQEVQNCIVSLNRPYSAGELQQAANFLNAKFAGTDIEEVRRQLVDELKSTRETMNQMMMDAISVAQEVFKQSGQDPGAGFVLAGETNLMEYSELSNVSKLRQLFEAFTKQREILDILDKCLISEGVQIFIGEESGYEILDDCSLVTAPYMADDGVIGVLGVIGPTRMAYERVIPIVD
ncbi:MAG: heat-inducible transcriptional repressor HrcA, partial [Pseudomonadota bacterium]